MEIFILIYLFSILLPAFILVIIGFAIRKSYAKTSKILYILSGIYLLVGTGLCGLILNSGF